MSFEIRNVIWTPIEPITKDELQPILSTFSDNVLEELTVDNLGLSKAGAGAFDGPYTSCYSFKQGRMVVASAINLSVIGEIVPPADERERWFSTGQHVVRLFRQTQQTCGGFRKQAGADIFGPLVQ